MAPFSAASASTSATSSRLRCEVLLLEARAAAPEVLLVEVVDRADPAGEEAAAERAVGDEADPELAHRRQDLRLGIARPERVLGLQRRDRMDGVRAANRVRGRLGEPEVAHLPLLDELGHRADGLLDRRLEVDAVLVVEVDRLDAEPLAATPRRRSGRTRALPLMPRYSPCGAAHVPELRREHDLGRGGRRSPCRRARSFAHGPYMSAVSRKVTPSSSARWIVAIASPSSVGAVELGHPHAAEPERRDLEPLRAQLPRLHRLTLAAASIDRCPLRRPSSTSRT